MKAQARTSSQARPGSRGSHPGAGRRSDCAAGADCTAGALLAGGLHRRDRARRHGRTAGRRLERGCRGSGSRSRRRSAPGCDGGPASGGAERAGRGLHIGRGLRLAAEQDAANPAAPATGPACARCRRRPCCAGRPPAAGGGKHRELVDGVLAPQAVAPRRAPRGNLFASGPRATVIGDAAGRRRAGTSSCCCLIERIGFTGTTITPR